MVLALALLAHLDTRPLPGRAREQGRLWAELAPVARRHTGPLLVVDPPGAIGPDLGWLFHPRLLGHAAPVAGFSPERVRGLSSAAFQVLSSSGAFPALRSEGLVVAAPARALGREETGLLIRALEVRDAPRLERLTWRALTHSPAAPIDPLDWESARIVADLAGTPRQIDQLGWDDEAGRSGVVAGTVAERGGRLVAEFDLSRSLAWRLAGPMRSLRVEKGVRGIERAELSARFPELSLAGEPRPNRSDWLLPLAPSRAQLEAGGTYTLFLLALSDFELLELALQDDGGGNLLARGAEAFRRRKSPAGLAWLLDYRIGPRVVQRARGTIP